MSVSQMTLEELFGQVMFSRTLNDDEYAIINRLLYNVRRGWIKLVD